MLAGVFQASLGGGSALGAAAGVAANEGFLTKLSGVINKGMDGDGIAHEGAMNLASIGLGLIAGGLMGDATSGAIAANTSQQYGYYDYRDGKRQLLASDALREMAGGDEALLQGMRTLINEAIKNGADPASLAAALTTPGVANNMAGMALVEASAQKEYGKSFGALGVEDQKILLGMVGKVYVEGVQSIGPDGEPLAAIGSVEKLPAVEVVGKSSGVLLHAGQLVSGVIESGGRGVERASNWLGQDTALALAYVAMAAAGGPVKTVASTLFENSAPGEFLQSAKQKYLIDPFGKVIGTYGLGAQNEQQLDSVKPASSVMAEMGVNSAMSAIGATTAGAGAKSVVESAQGIGGKIDAAKDIKVELHEISDNKLTVKIDSSKAAKGTAEYDILNSPAARSPNTRYELDNGNSFKTNSAGQVEELSFTPSNVKVPRDSRQTAAGKEGRDTDVGGHAQACSQGGSCDGYNLFPQDSNFNNSAYKVFYENEIKRALNDPGRVVGQTTIKYGRARPDSPRPDTLSVTYTIDGKVRTRVFENESKKFPVDK